jgi:lipoprotein-releasing system permease protein
VSFPWFIAKRYFLSGRKKNFINLISIISMAALAIATAALIIVLSVFNGLESLLRSLNNSFDPELKVMPVKGKSFLVSDSLIQRIQTVDGVKIVTEVIEDYAYVRYREADMVATIKGVSQNFIDQHRMDEALTQGSLVLVQDSVEHAVIGQGVQYTLSLPLADTFNPLQVFYIKNTSGISALPTDLYYQQNIQVSGVFSIEKNIDENYIVLPLRFAQRLLNYGSKRTSLEIQTTGRTKEVQQSVQRLLGEGFHVLTNEQQHKDLYRLLKFEKLFTFLAFVLLVLIAAINVFFSLMMLVIDKKRDLTILTALGARDRTIRMVFLYEGVLIGCLGVGSGLVLGAFICWLQQTFGLVGMGMANAIVNDYPVTMQASDFLITAITLVLIASAMAVYPARMATRSYQADSL